jgi:transcriptional regulator with XRE-family HTH domain
MSQNRAEQTANGAAQPNRPARTAEDLARYKAIRERFQREKPSLEDLVSSGEYNEPLPMGEYLSIRQAVFALKKAREAAGLSLADVAERTGIDKAALSRIETGQHPNPTVSTLCRYAHALGKRWKWLLENEANPENEATPGAQLGGHGLGKLKGTSNQTPGSPECDPRLREAFENAERIFWCNTNREGFRGYRDEQQMHQMQFAAAWTAPKGTFRYPAHMQRVQCGDVIVMYANGVGIIGIGRATESGVEVLKREDPNRMRDFTTEGENAQEWRIPVEWLVWDNDNPCVIDSPLPVSFQDITNHAERIGKIRRHFRCGE